MTEEKALTPEQIKALDKLSRNFLLGSVLTGVYHAIMLTLMNVVITLAVLALELPELFMYVGAIVAGVFVFRRMLSITKEKHDRLSLEVKKITEQ